VLILPPGHAKALRARGRLSVREKWILGSVLAAVAAIIVAVVISLATAEHRTGGGCVDVKFPITIGGAELYQCGTQARSLCAGANATPWASSVADRAVAEQCRKAGIPVG
jgi:hypothetical protein